MTTVIKDSVYGAVDPSDDPLPIVSADSHVGPRLAEDLRQYCPKKYLDEFDAFTAAVRTTRDATNDTGPGKSHQSSDRPAHAAKMRLNAQTEGHYDMHARLRDMDSDGVAAEALFHGSQNLEPMPFGVPVAKIAIGQSQTLSILSEMPPRADLERMTVGMEIYNRWLAEAISVAPDRLIGLVHIPAWDVDESVKTIRRARENGLSGVNWPAPRSYLPEYDEPTWEPIWSVCDELEMVLATHAGTHVPGNFRDDPNRARYGQALVQIESGGFPSRRGVGRMLFGGVFQRHPGLRIVLAELAGGWWAQTVSDMDSAYLDNREVIGDHLPQPPSAYFAKNVFIGASFISDFEARDAVENSYDGNVIWGRDYPHAEGSWSYGLETTRLHLRYAFSAIPDDSTRRMLSENGIRFFRLDEARLRRVAQEIGAPKVSDLKVAVESVPDVYSKAFRKSGAWA